MKIFLALALGLLALARADARTTEVTAVVDMTEEGRKVVHPDPRHPAFYLPVLSGFTELGGVVGHGEKPPPVDHVIRVIAEALARQGYLVAHPVLIFNPHKEVVYADNTVVTVPRYPRPGRLIVPNRRSGYPLTVDMLESSDGPYSLRRPQEADFSPVPSPLLQVLRAIDPVHGPVMQALPTLAISIRWGDSHPGNTTVDPSQPAIPFGQGTMLALIAGNTFANLSRWDRDEIRQRIHVDRFFFVVTAFDFQQMYLKHKSVMLWSAKMTMPSNFDAELDPLLPALVGAGEPHFGRESTRPEMTSVDLSPGRVIIGTPEVKEGDVPSPNPGPAPAK